MAVQNDGEIENDNDSETNSMPPLEDNNEKELVVHDELLVTGRVLIIQSKEADSAMRENLLYQIPRSKQSV